MEKPSPSSQEKPPFDMVRNFFERLWWYDQVVFDASAALAIGQHEK